MSVETRPPLRVVLVTAEITHVPGNYLSFFETLLAERPDDVVGLVVLKYVSLQHFVDIGLLYLTGAPRMASTLLANTVSHWRGDKRRLFAARGIPVAVFDSMNDEDALGWVRAQKADVVVNLRTRCIFKDPALAVAEHGCLNIHHGLLPEERGMLCDLYALAEGKPAGFSIHRMVKKVDAGDIYAVEPVSRPGEKDYMRYLGTTGEVEARALARVLRHLATEGALPPALPNTPAKSRWRRVPKTLKDVLALRRSGVKL